MERIGFHFIFNLISHIITLNKINPDIIHINNGGYPGASSCNTMVMAAKLLRHKCIIYQVNNLAQKRGTNFINKLIDSFINKNVSYFITASQQAKEKLIKERNFDADKIKKISNTIQDDKFSLSKEEVLSSLAINLTDFVLCTVAFLSKRKGQKFLLEALCLIRKSHPCIFKKLKLILVGNGEEELFLKNYDKEHELVENVFFLGYKSNAHDYINACDVFILPSISNEDMPLAVLSAMRIGKTIVSTDLAGIQEEIENGKTGILVSPNVDTIAIELADVIIELYNDMNPLLGEQAKKRFINMFSQEIYGNSLVKLYNEVNEQKK